MKEKLKHIILKQTKYLKWKKRCLGNNKPAANSAFVLLGLTNTVFQLSVRCSAFFPSLTFTIEQQNKILSLVTTFSCRPAMAGRIDEVPPTAQMRGRWGSF